MNFEKSKTGCLIVPNRILKDSRGHFTELFKAGAFEFDTKQVNCSYSHKGVVRGMHFQKAPHNQSKFVRVLSGQIVDIVVDLNHTSPTYGIIEEFHLDPDNFSILIPNTHAHGFCTLAPTTFLYLCDNVYNKASEGGINPDHPAFKWCDKPEISDKDKELPSLESVLSQRIF